MKNIFIVLWVAVLTLTFPACKEIGPDINLHGNQNAVADTTYIESPPAAAEAKNAVIEEFTGVRCPNCPQGHVVIANLKSQYPGRVVAVALHPVNSLGSPYPFSPVNLEDQKSQTLFDYLQQVGFEPAGAVDRQLFSGQSNILLDKTYWSSYTAQELALTPPVNILLSGTYDSVNGQANIVVELHYTQNMAQPNSLTLAVIEDSIITPQLDGSVIDTFYVHNDVLRDIITDTKGTPITPALQAGRVIRKTYNYALNATWSPRHINVVAFVHEYQNSKVIYQAKEIKLIN